MSEREFREKLTKLRELIAIKDVQIMLNPKHYLEDMSHRCGELLDVLEEVEYALSPDMVFDYWNDHANKEVIQKPQDINGEALIRCNKALEVLHEYKGS